MPLRLDNHRRLHAVQAVQAAAMRAEAEESVERINMAKPWIHALSSARKRGGKPEDYLDIHELMDSSKSAMADSRHRALTHNSWFLSTILERVFGSVRTNSDGKTYSVRDIGEQHILEDFAQRFIPSAQDYLAEMEFKDWMLRGKGNPPSFAKIAEKEKREARSPTNTLVD